MSALCSCNIDYDKLFPKNSKSSSINLVSVLRLPKTPQKLHT